MNTLELTLQRKTESGCPVIAALTRPGGFLSLRREGMLNLDVATLAELQYEPLAYGTALGQALFVDEIRDTFREGMAGGEALRVLLSIEAPDLRALEWHRLAAPFDGRWRCLASQQNTPFSLSVPSPASAHFPALGRRDLRALVLVAGPESLSGDYKLAPFDVPATIAGIREALGDIPCDIIDNPSLDALCAALTATPYTFLHIVCHGSVKKETGETILFFPKDSKGGPTPASELLNRLSSLARLPHFAFISACDSALPQNGLGSLAGRLVRELGLPAVLAMTDRVSIATAEAIAKPFYTHLYQHGQPDLALAQSLAGLQGAHDLTVPAIFSRLGDRPLFDDNAERALTDKELEFGLTKLAEVLPERAPVLIAHLDSLARRLRSTLGADSKSLSESSRTERKETLDQLNSLSLEALDLSFHALCLGQTPPAYDLRSPFRGLESFRPEDAAYFFGREALTRKLVQKLNEHNFLAVLGASGSGKSSLVMAGLIPTLNIPYAIFRPGAEPLAELDKALQAAPQLLVVDQFEELFTLSAREQRSNFISRLLEQSQKIRVVITLRADFLGEVAPFKSLKDEVENHQVIIPPMDETELRRAMEGQAGCAGLRFESDLSKQMLDDVLGEPGAMPLLQHALWTLWTRRHGRWLRAEEYRAFGGVKQAIASTAEAVFARCTDFEKERLRDIFLRLTRLDDSADGRDTRRRVLLSDLIPADSDPAATTLLIKQLADARLLVVTGDEVEVAHEALIRHWERLRAWLNDDRDNLRLREGVSDDARRWENAARDESLLNHRGARLELALAMSKNPRYRLNPVEQAYLDGCVGLREREKAAVAKRRKYTVAGISVALSMIMAILAGWGWTSNKNAVELQYQVATADAAKNTAIAETNIRATAQANAENQSKISRASELVNQSIILRTENFQNSLLLSVEAAKLNENVQTRGNLLDIIQLHPNLLRYLGVRSTTLTVSPDSKTIFIGDEIGNVSMWDIKKGVNPEKILIGHKSAVISIVFSHNGKILATASNDGTIILWDTTTWLPIKKFFTLNNRKIIFSHDDNILALIGIANTDRITPLEFLDLQSHNYIGKPYHKWRIESLVFSDDGKLAILCDTTGNIVQINIAQQEINLREQALNGYGGLFSMDGDIIAAGHRDGRIYLWNTQNQQILGLPILAHTDTAIPLAFSGDGKLLVSMSPDQTLKIWETASQRLVGNPITGNSMIGAVFSPDKKYLVVSSNSNVAIWDITIHEVQPVPIPIDTASSLAFSPNKKFIAVGHVFPRGAFVESAIFFSELGKNKEHILFSEYISSINSVIFSPNGKILASGNEDNTIVLWNTQTGEMIGKPLAKHHGAVTALAFSPDGNILASGSKDHSIILWELLSSKAVGEPLILHNGYVTALAFSSDGKMLASGSDDHTINLWAINQQVILTKTLTHHNGRIIALEFSPDNHLLASSDYHNFLLWDMPSGKLVYQVFFDKGSSILDFAFSPDGKMVAVATGEGQVYLLDTDSGKFIGKPIVDEIDSIRGVTFSINGRAVIGVSTHRGQYYLKDVVLSAWIEKACQLAGMNFTRAEWAQYFPGEPYRATCTQWPLEPEPTATPSP